MCDLLRLRPIYALVLMLGISVVPTAEGSDGFTQAAADRMISAAEGKLAPVYAPLAEEIVKTLDIKDKEGIGIDLGSGPGTLIVELCRHTRLHWIDADINPHFFPYFLRQAETAGLAGRVSAIQADAQDLPFRDNFADVVVSRGSFPFWPDQLKCFAEILRVLKPGGVAYVGRGFPSTLPPETARAIRSRQGKAMNYDVDKTERKLRHFMQILDVTDYRIIRPQPDGSEGVNYGIWIQFRKAPCEPAFDIAHAPAPLFSDPVWDGAADPAPVWNEARGEWWVYYTQRRATLQPNQGVEYCHGSAIGIAASKDGRQWRYEGICVGDDNLGDPIAGNCSWWAPAVLACDGVYHMYVSWVDGIYTDWSGKRFIKHFTSRDGKNWTYQSRLALSSDRCIDAGVYRTDGAWYMLYKDEVNQSHSYLARSNNLYQWTVVGPTISDVSHEAPVVWQWHGVYWLMVDSWQRGIRIYRSDNGVDDWQFVSAILQKPGKRPKDDARGGHPGIICIGDRAVVLYFVHYRPDHPLYGNRRTVLQAAELEYHDGKITCDRNTYAHP